MQDFEKLGVFYLGKTYDLAAGKPNDGLLLYDAKDLTTHAVIIGMTGSGKTGLGIGLLEEAAIDHVPIIAIDPKGDLGNLLLTFPDLAAQDFLPWLPPPQAGATAEAPEVRAEALAQQWRKGLADWGQDGERIRRLREAVELTIYTPGSSAGTPLSVLRSFEAPPAAVRDDADLYRERIQATAQGVLTLLGIDADPLTSREHVLLANLLAHAWQNGQGLDIAGLIRGIQQPPFERVGVLDVESFYPGKERATLAMQLNNLLAAPGFAAWMEGEPLDSGRLLFNAAGKPRVSVISIAHLSDRERMFFVATLLNDVVSWMRAQAGTTSLRAILYMDEIFGYLPPTANPPSKLLFLTLLKQARAFGLGLVLATQNPVDLDYKALSNIGTWFLGRLQTERDKARVLEGLEGAAAGSPFSRAEMDKTLSALGKRVFLMHNVNEDHPVVFNTRWALSYLAGPLTREQIKLLKPAAPVAAPGTAGSPSTPLPAEAAPTTGTQTVTATRPSTTAPDTQPASAAGSASAIPAGPPVLPPQVVQYFLPPAPGANPASMTYRPLVVAAADVTYANARYDVQATRRVVRLCPISDSAVPVDWNQSADANLDPADLEQRALDGARFAALPVVASDPKRYAEWEKLFSRWLRSEQPLTLYRSPSFKLVSRVDESEGEFRTRLQQLAHEQRDDQVAALRKRYITKVSTLEERLQRAEQTLVREEAEAQSERMGSMLSLGESLLGGLLGRKRNTLGKAMRDIGELSGGSGEVERAQQSVEKLRDQLIALQAELEREIDELEGGFDAQREVLEPVEIAPKSSDVHVHFVGLAWRPA